MLILNRQRELVVKRNNRGVEQNAMLVQVRGSLALVPYPLNRFHDNPALLLKSSEYQAMERRANVCP